MERVSEAKKPKYRLEKEDAKQTSTDYQYRNRRVIKENVKTCECGTVVNQKHLKRHVSSLKHMEFSINKQLIRFTENKTCLDFMFSISFSKFPSPPPPLPPSPHSPPCARLVGRIQLLLRRRGCGRQPQALCRHLQPCRRLCQALQLGRPSG